MMKRILIASAVFAASLTSPMIAPFGPEATAQETAPQKSPFDLTGIEVYKKYVEKRNDDNLAKGAEPFNVQADLDQMMECALQRNRLAGRTLQLPIMIDYSADFQLLVRHLDYYLKSLESISKNFAGETAGNLIQSVPDKAKYVETILATFDETDLSSVTDDMKSLGQACQGTIKRTRQIENEIKFALSVSVKAAVEEMAEQEKDAARTASKAETSDPESLSEPATNIKTRRQTAEDIIEDLTDAQSEEDPFELEIVTLDD